MSFGTPFVTSTGSPQPLCALGAVQDCRSSPATVANPYYDHMHVAVNMKGEWWRCVLRFETCVAVQCL